MILAQVSPSGLFAQLYVLAAQLLFWASVALFAVAASPLGRHLLVRIVALLLLAAALVNGGVAVWSGANADLFLSGKDRRWLSTLVITIGLLLLAWLISRRVAKRERQRSADRLRVAIVLAAAFAIVLVTWVVVAVLGAAFASVSGQRLHHEQALWRSDGTAGGTRIVTTLPDRVDNAWSTPVVVGEYLFFLLNNGSDERIELWKSDGTAQGTGLVKDLSPGRDTTGRGFGPKAVGIGRTLYFVFEERSHGAELWKSDGTAQGTGLVRDLVPGPNGSVPGRLQPAGGRLVFFVGLNRAGYAPDIFIEPGIWSTDGTAEGTILLQAGTVHGYGSAVVGDEVFFLTQDAVWRTDGTPAGTRRIQDLPLSADQPCHTMGGPVAAGGDLFITASDGLYAVRTAGGPEANSAPTVRLVAAIPGLCSDRVVAAGDLVYFVTQPLGAEGVYQLWRSDGTAGGTRLLRASPQMGELTAAGRRVFFSAATEATGYEPWNTAGTVESTRPVVDVIPGPAWGMQDHVTALGEKILFANTRGLWTSDGTAAGTVRIHRAFQNSDFAIMSGTAYWLGEEITFR